MKKIFAAVICIALTTATTFAKHNQQAPAPVVNHKVEAQHRPHHDPVVDMELIKAMGLSPKKVQQIEALKQRKQHEMAALHPKAKQHHKGQHHRNPAVAQQAKARRAQMKAFKEEYRKELCKIMGKDKYIAYVELQNDKMSQHRHHHAQGHKGHPHQSAPAHKGHPHAPNKG